MTIAVHERTLAPNDPLLSITSQPMTAIRISLEGVAEDMVYLAGVCFAWLEPTSPKQGVLAHVTDLGYTLIAYCADTRRTSVMAVELPKVNDDSTYAEQFSWLTKGTGATVECLIVYLRQFFPNFDAVISALRKAAASLAIELSINTYIAPPQAGLIEVLRATPACTFLYAPPGMLNPDSAIAPGVPILNAASILAACDLFATNESRAVPLPLWKRYDGQRGAGRLPILSDATRSQLQAAREVNIKDGRRTGKKRAYSVVAQLHDKLVAPTPTCDITSTLSTVTDMQIAAILALGAYCPVCGSSRAVKLCAACEAETYCSVEHQRKDWPHHKGWCKQNRKSKDS